MLGRECRKSLIYKGLYSRRQRLFDIVAYFFLLLIAIYLVLNTAFVVKLRTTTQMTHTHTLTIKPYIFHEQIDYEL